MAAPTAASERFRYETEYVVLSFLGRPAPRSLESASASGGPSEHRERELRIKAQVEGELRRLEDDITSFSAITGFDRHTSLLLRPPTPDRSFHDRLVALGDRVVSALGPHLTSATHTLLSGPVDYQRFRDTALDLSTHMHGGWNQVLVPLLLLQALHEDEEAMSLRPLVALVVHYLEENAAPYISQQGGWGAVFDLYEEEEEGVAIAEDNNDIYILSGDQPSDRGSPPAFPSPGNDDDNGSWQTESLASLTEPLGGPGGPGAWVPLPLAGEPLVGEPLVGECLAEERSDNNSSSSDIVHVEREEAELLLEEGGGGGGGDDDDDDDDDNGGAELQESSLSILGTESELAELRAWPVEEPRVVEETSAGPPPAEPLPLPAPLLVEVVPPPIPSRPEERLPEPEAAAQLLAAAGTAAHEEEEAYVEASPCRGQEGEASPPRGPGAPDLQVLLCGGAALVAVAAVLLYVMLSCRRK